MAMDTETNKLPSVLVLKPFTPTEVMGGSGERLEYPNLAHELGIHALLESAHWGNFLDSEKGSTDELKSAKNLAAFYLLKTSHALQSSTGTSRDIWAERFTVASEELYETEISREIWRSIFDVEISRTEQSESPVANKLLEAYEKLGYSADAEKQVEEQKTQEILPDSRYGEIIKQRFGSVLDLVKEGEQYDPSAMGELFTEAFTKMAEVEDDETWNDWSVEYADKDVLSVVSDILKVRIGKNRASETSEGMQKLLAHELLVHAARAQHARKLTNPQLVTGLPGYLDAEEGLGILHEAAISGEIPAKAADRYIDIGIAKGLLGRQPSRRELIEIVALRLELRESSDEESDDYKRRARAHVNRFYRGGHGDEGPASHAVFTKDAVYYVGYQKICAYINQELDSGKNPEELFDYLLAGKFDPTNESHVRIVGDEHERVETDE